MIDAGKLNEVLIDCLFKEEEIVDGKPIVEPVKVVGIMREFGFHPGRLESHKEEINGMLDQLPEKFHEGVGGGYSFLNACMDKEGNQWGEHSTVELLMCLGTAIGRVAYCLPREIWGALPGGMPYFVVKKKV